MFDLLLQFKQAAMNYELKRWCMSHLKDMDVCAPVKAQYYKLLPSPSVEQSVVDADMESLPLLSVVSEDSSTSLANYVNVVPSRTSQSLRSQELEQVGRRTYFEMRVDRSPGMSNKKSLQCGIKQWFVSDANAQWDSVS